MTTSKPDPLPLADPAPSAGAAQPPDGTSGPAMAESVPTSQNTALDLAAPDISIVIPMKNEAENVAALLRGIAAALAGQRAEVIVVDDASTDDTGAAALALSGEVPGLRVVRHGTSGGQSAAVHSGVLAARGRVICTLDGDGQNPPENLPLLFAPLLADPTGRLGLVAGQRVARQDTWSKRAGSKFANALRRWMLKDGTRDTGCGLKGFRRDAFLALPYFDHMHRYLPALMKRDGWEIELVDVTHRERQAGRSNYTNLQRAWVGIFDLMGVAWLIRRRKKARPVASSPESVLPGAALAAVSSLEAIQTTQPSAADEAAQPLSPSGIGTETGSAVQSGPQLGRH